MSLQCHNESWWERVGRDKRYVKTPKKRDFAHSADLARRRGGISAGAALDAFYIRAFFARSALPRGGFHSVFIQLLTVSLVV